MAARHDGKGVVVAVYAIICSIRLVMPIRRWRPFARHPRITQIYVKRLQGRLVGIVSTQARGQGFQVGFGTTCRCCADQKEQRAMEAGKKEWKHVEQDSERCKENADPNGRSQ